MMFTISILTTLLLPVALVQSAPGLDLDLTTRDASCPGNQEWCGWTKSCKCDKDYIWDNKNQKCHYPAWPQYNCPQGQKYYCGKSETEYCEYDAENEYCYNDGHNKAFCCEQKDRPKKLKEKCPNDHPSCKSGQIWDGDSKTCRCKNGKVWRDGTCKHPVMRMPSCSGKEKPYCAKNKNDWCGYDESRNECSDNGKHITFCAKPGYEQTYCNKYWG